VRQLHRCPLLVLDEADQLLAPNFAEDMMHVTDHCGQKGGRAAAAAERGGGLWSAGGGALLRLLAWGFLRGSAGW
jgi:superfamily II DNA/RNA helicase